MANKKPEVITSKRRFTRVKDIFGKLKFKEPIEKIMREVDQELKGDFD